MRSGHEQPATPPMTQSEQAESSTMDNESSRKRMAIGLSPQRPTAQTTLQRPPEHQSNDRRRIWTLVGLIVAMMLATMLLIVVRMAEAPTSWPAVLRSVADVRIRLLDPTEAGVRILSVQAAETQSRTDVNSIEMNFAESGPTLGELARPDAFVVGPEGLVGVYRMRLWPDNMAWTIIGPDCSDSHRVEAEVTVDAATPSGHALLLGRFHDDGNFYFFGVNGEQKFEVVMVKDGVWTPMQAPQFDAVINPAGMVNTLDLYDDGETAKFTVNGKRLYLDNELRLPIGQVGLAAWAAHAPAQIDFKRFQLSSSSCQRSEAAK